MDTLKRDVVSPPMAPMALYRVVSRVRTGQEITSTHSEGSQRVRLAQGQTAATSDNKIYEREGTSHQASNRKPRPQNPRYRRGIVVNARSKMGSAANPR